MLVLKIASLGSLVGFLLSFPSSLYACAVCTGAVPEPVAKAYNYSTAWLSLVPLLFMAGVAYYIYRRVKSASLEN